ncbi:hypothetical protein [Bacillus cereus group sp. TH150LC]|uniref:hypothetical protein n=1 Tax=Bacillus cereus group sp. TH150LC TaxID=3018061 RepID=UPI0022E381BC|nr:hypothetical protein [Bacillus cereus group sp. TH150LC]MDA1658162.1 hypothetical protein [Bacillus cereus group sp. TH150LC]HDR4513822.1 hypothetical protein [Bacillus cereus]
MTKISFYISSLLDDNSSIMEFEKKIISFCDLLDDIIDNDDQINIPSEFYTSTIDGNITLAEYLFDPQHASDPRDLLCENIREYKTKDIDYLHLYELLDEKDNVSYNALVGMHANKYINEDRLYINTRDKLFSPQRFYLGQLKSIDSFKEDFQSCFPNLVFHERVKHTLNAFNDITTHSSELIRHLSVLNDSAKNLYITIGRASDEIYDRLRSEFNIIASGRGANEGLHKFQCQFYNIHNKVENIRCNPHTKLYYAHSDFRIYFSWGREDIEGGKILVGHIGNHWRD